jgi:putative ABC transport system ATP-binding protein
VAIARALVNHPPIILADEPTGNLDSATGDEIMALLGDLNAEGQTIIMVTHNPENAAFARGIIRLKDGRIQGRSKGATKANEIFPDIVYALAGDHLRASCACARKRWEIR